MTFVATTGGVGATGDTRRGVLGRASSSPIGASAAESIARGSASDAIARGIEKGNAQRPIRSSVAGTSAENWHQAGVKGGVLCKGGSKWLPQEREAQKKHDAARAGRDDRPSVGADANKEVLRLVKAERARVSHPAAPGAAFKIGWHG